MTSAFAAGSISVNLYAYDGLTPVERADAVVADASIVERAGFDGITVSEHHAGTRGYFPVPITVATWILEQTTRPFVAPMPVVTPLRPVVGLIEEIAWVAARHPGRLGVGVAPGYSHDDFELHDVPFEERVARFSASLERIVGALDGDSTQLGALAGDPAVAALGDDRVPVVSAAGGAVAARRAARSGCGLVFGSHSTAMELDAAVRAFRWSGGVGPIVVSRRVWLGSSPPAALTEQFAMYQRLGRGDAPWRADVQAQQVVTGRAAEVVDALAGVVQASGSTALSLRVHAPGLEPSAVRDQLEQLGRDVVPQLRAALAVGVVR